MDETKKVPKKKSDSIPTAEFAARLGILYSIGWGLEKNYEKAQKWLERATDLNDADCLYLLYCAGVRNKIRKENQLDDEFLNYLEAAAEKGNAKAAYLLGEIFSTEKVPILQDYPMALRYFQTAAAGGSDDAKFQLARLYEKGLGVEKDEKLALDWYCKAAENGEVRALLRLCDEKTAAREFSKRLSRYQSVLKRREKSGGLEEEHGSLVSGVFLSDKDLTKNVEWLERAANGGDGEMANIAGLISSEAAATAEDLVDAVKYFQIAVDAGNTDAMLNLAELYRSGRGVTKDLNKMQALLLQAADANSGLAAFRLGQVFEKGIGVKRDHGTALTWYEKAAGMKNDDAMLLLAKMFQTGRGVEKDSEKAFGLYRDAAKDGSPDALIALSNAYRKGIGTSPNLALAAGFAKQALEATAENARLYLRACGEKDLSRIKE